LYACHSLLCSDQDNDNSLSDDALEEDLCDDLLEGEEVPEEEKVEVKKKRFRDAMMNKFSVLHDDPSTCNNPKVNSPPF
jgi:hypothetical protein